MPRGGAAGGGAQAPSARALRRRVALRGPAACRVAEGRCGCRDHRGVRTRGRRSSSPGRRRSAPSAANPGRAPTGPARRSAARRPRGSSGAADADAGRRHPGRGAHPRRRLSHGGRSRVTSPTASSATPMSASPDDIVRFSRSGTRDHYRADRCRIGDRHRHRQRNSAAVTTRSNSLSPCRRWSPPPRRPAPSQRRPSPRALPTTETVSDYFRRRGRSRIRRSLLGQRAVATVAVNGVTVTVAAVAAGKATVTVTATNAGGSAEQEFAVTVVPPATARAHCCRRHPGG